MKIKVANYISQFLVDHGVTDAFSVVGGGAMHLNDAFGHQEGLHTHIIITSRLAQLPQRLMQGLKIKLRLFA